MKNITELSNAIAALANIISKTELDRTRANIRDNIEALNDLLNLAINQQEKQMLNKTGTPEKDTKETKKPVIESQEAFNKFFDNWFKDIGLAQILGLSSQKKEKDTGIIGQVHPSKYMGFTKMPTNTLDTDPQKDNSPESKGGLKKESLNVNQSDLTKYPHTGDVNLNTVLLDSLVNCIDAEDYKHIFHYLYNSLDLRLLKGHGLNTAFALVFSRRANEKYSLSTLYYGIIKKGTSNERFLHIFLNEKAIGRSTKMPEYITVSEIEFVDFCKEKELHFITYATDVSI
jgi:hypothetical protein